MPSPTISVVDDIMAAIQLHFNNQPIKIYTDGSWKATGSGRDRALLMTTTSIGGGGLVIVASSADWKDQPVLVYSIVDDGTSPTAHAYTWELMALATAALVQSRYAHGCQLYSDCTSAIHIITNSTPSSALLDQHSVLLYPVSQLQQRPSVQHIAAHPEIHIANTRPWTQDECGIHLADLAASHTAQLMHMRVVTPITSNIQSSALLHAFHRVGTWSWCYASSTPILVPIKSIWQQHTLQSYLQHRDESRVRVPTSATWCSRSWRLTALVHRFNSSTTAERSRNQRILLQWSGIGVNLHRDQPQSAEALCPSCNVPESEQHLLCVCNDLITRQTRVDATLEAAQYINQHIHHNPLAHFMLCLHAALTTHHHGYLMFFGFLTENLIQTLPTYDHDDIQLNLLQKSVITYLRILSKGGIAVIDHARARRQRAHQRPSGTVIHHRGDAPTHRDPPSQRSTAAVRNVSDQRNRPTPRPRKSTSTRLKRLAHEVGLADIHTRHIEGNHLITDFFKRQRISTQSSHSVTSTPHDHALVHPP